MRSKKEMESVEISHHNKLLDFIYFSQFNIFSINECLTWYVRIPSKILKLCFEFPFTWNEPICSLHREFQQEEN